MITITRDIAEKLRDTVDQGLSHGLGNPKPGEMCVEAAVCFALGLPHGDDPGCVAEPLRRLKIRLNDAAWSSPQARAKGLRRLALIQLGSKGVLDEAVFRARVVEMTIRRAVPISLRAAAKRNPAHAEALEAVAVRCETEGTREAALNAERVARAAYAAAASAASYAAYAAAAAAADAAAAAYAEAVAADAAAAAAADAAAAAYAEAVAADAAAAAAADAAYAAADDAADDAAAADARTRDRVLADYAEWVVEILINMAVPGCEWLDLVPLEATA